MSLTPKISTSLISTIFCISSESLNVKIATLVYVLVVGGMKLNSSIYPNFSNSFLKSSILMVMGMWGILRPISLALIWESKAASAYSFLNSSMK